ncbi:hypothetical protein [Rhodococcus jostii]|uniref:hypothetical protein n=1 Tax=Rhodococcus jostii TaxID=132919 RepID=UPI00363524D9
MARTVVFDPAEREQFDEQRQRFDWTPLQPTKSVEQTVRAVIRRPRELDRGHAGILPES